MGKVFTQDRDTKEIGGDLGDGPCDGVPMRVARNVSSLATQPRGRNGQPLAAGSVLVCGVGPEHAVAKYTYIC